MKLQIPPIGAAVVLTVLCMGVVGMFVLVPIACIQWMWNSIMNSWRFLPLINVWQAALLYVMLATILYLTGLVRVEFEAENLE